MTGMNKFLKQAKVLQEKMEHVQKEIANSLIEVETGGGAILIQISGDHVLQSLKIKPEVVDPKDIEALEDLILTAVNQALVESKKFAEEKSKEATGNMTLPAGLM
jgi:DNA-binding YbaB/EbfC family protein